MVEIWIPITVLAAFSQNVRSALQKHLKSSLSTVGATQARFLYAVPFALAYFYVLCTNFGYSAPEPNAAFFLYAFTGGLSQIVATALLVALFSHRNFIVGTSYSKTETIQAAILGLIILSDPLTLGAVVGITLGFIGVLVMSSKDSQYSLSAIVRSLGTRAALLGITAGFFFGISAISYRAASLSLQGGFVIQAAFTLIIVLIFQTAMVGAYLIIREPGQLTQVLKHWRIASLVGLSGMIGSVGWFTAMTIQNAAYVRAVGQIELIFAFIASVVIFKEKIKLMEMLGVSIIMLSILILLFFK